MNRTTLEIVFVATIASNLIVYSVTKSVTREANTITMETNSAASQPPQIIKSTSRLVYHSKMIAVESVLVARYSVNLMFDAVIKAL
jgi:hypothetical protein